MSVADTIHEFLLGGCVEMSDEPRRNELQIQLVRLADVSPEAAEFGRLLVEFFEGDDR